MKAVVAAFNQEKALVGAFSVIVQPVVEPMEHYTALVTMVDTPVSWASRYSRPAHRYGRRKVVEASTRSVAPSPPSLPAARSRWTNQR